MICCIVQYGVKNKNVGNTRGAFMNFVYLYPNLLNNYYKYTQALQKNGVTVLGI